MMDQLLQLRLHGRRDDKFVVRPNRAAPRHTATPNRRRAVGQINQECKETSESRVEKLDLGGHSQTTMTSRGAASSKRWGGQ